MLNSSCRLLSNGYKFQINENNYLQLTPCCAWQGPALHSITADNATDYRNFLNTIDTNTNSNCATCQYHEKNNIRKSWRQFSHEIVPESSIPGDATYLELQLDNTCNGGCIICGPWFSTFWQQELYKNVTPIKQTVRDAQIDKILSIIDIQKTRRILFLGGETFLTDIDSKILPLIQNPELVDLQYTINCSIYPSQERIDLWKKFKSVQITLSIDGVGERFNYIRYPLKWYVVTDNVNRMINEMPANVFFIINHVANIFNLYYWDEFESWCQKHWATDRQGKEIKVGNKMNFNTAAGILNPQSITPALWNLLTNKYPAGDKVLRTVTDTNLDTTELHNYINALDQRRRLDWRAVFPEIADCF